MIQSLDIRRHPDGSTDFDFYRRRATRWRRLARRAVIRHYLRVIARPVRDIIISAIQRSSVDRSQDQADACRTKRAPLSLLSRGISPSNYRRGVAAAHR